MKTLKLLSLSAIVLIVLSACNKTKTNSKRLIKAGEWQITELSVDGSNEAELPTWEIEDCELYSESCFGEWENEEGGHAEFIWQFRDNGETFEISYQAEEEEEHDHEHDHAAEEAAAQAYAFSGVYKVIERKSDEMEFTTTSALGHTGKDVTIKIEKK